MRFDAYLSSKESMGSFSKGLSDPAEMTGGIVRSREGAELELYGNKLAERIKYHPVNGPCSHFLSILVCRLTHLRGIIGALLMRLDSCCGP